MPDIATSPPSWIEEELDPGHYYRTLRRHWVLLLVGALLGAMAGLSAAVLRPILYEGVTTILIGRSNSAIASATSRALLENYTLAAQTVNELGIGLTAQTFVRNNLVVDQVTGTNVMKVRVRLDDAAKAADASRLLSRKAVELNRRIASEEGTAVRAQLKGLLDESLARLNVAAERYVQYEDKAQIELLKKDTEKMVAQRGDLLRLRINVATEKARLVAAEQELQKHSPTLAIPRAAAVEAGLRRTDARVAAAEVADRVLSDVADRTAVLKSIADRPLAVPTGQDVTTEDISPERRDERGAEQARLQNRELEQRFAAQSAAVDETQNALGQLVARAGEADSQMLDLSHPFINPVYQTLSFQIATSRTRLAALEREQQEMLGSARLGRARFDELTQLYRRTSELARLDDDLELAKKIHGDLTVRYEQSRSESVDSMVQLQIVDEATTPDRPLSRKRGQSVVLGFAAGLVCAAFLSLAIGSGRRGT